MDLCPRYRDLTMGIELKVWHDGAPDPLAEGLVQLEGYLAGLGLDTGWLVIFDRRSGQLPLAERLSESEQTSPGARRIRRLRLQEGQSNPCPTPSQTARVSRKSDQPRFR